MVTGASSGIGEAMVATLAQQSIPQVVVARRGDRLAQLAERFPAIEVLVADLTTAEGLDRVVQRLHSADAPIDLLVNNAGFGTTGDFIELDPARLANEVQLNVGALTTLSHAALVTMRARGRGYLLNVSSVASFQPAPGAAVYAATKAYVTSLTEALHEECRGTGVHVTALCPGFTRTEFHQVANAQEYASKYPNFSWLSADAVALAGLNDVANNKAVSVPGALYKVFSAASAVMPRRVLRRGSAWARTR